MHPETKSSRSQTADVVMASKTLSGCRIGRWLHRVHSTSGFGPDWSEDATFVFAHPDGSPWTFEYFHFHYLYPALEAQCETDPLLCAFDGTPGNYICEKFYLGELLDAGEAGGSLDPSCYFCACLR
jgi:hypothetical protein